MARPERFELPTYSSGGCRSIQLSYGRAIFSLHRTPEPSKSETFPAGREDFSTYVQRRITSGRVTAAAAFAAATTTPPPPVRSGFGRASFTFSVRPPS